MHASSAPDEPGRGTRPGVTWEPFGIPDSEYDQAAERGDTAAPQFSTWSPLNEPCVYLPIIAFTIIMSVAALVVAVCCG